MLSKRQEHPGDPQSGDRRRSERDDGGLRGWLREWMAESARYRLISSEGLFGAVLMAGAG